MDKPGLSQLLLIPLTTLLGIMAVLLLGGAAHWIVLLALLAGGVGFYVLVWGKMKRDFQRLGQYLQDIGPRVRPGALPALELEEFEDLARQLDSAQERLETTLRRLEINREELRLVLSLIGDALWVQNYDGELKWGNEPFRALFTAFDPEKKQKYWEVIRDLDLLNALESLEDRPEQQLADVQLNGHAYLLSASRDDQTRRRVCILHDIETIRQTHQMKKDFIVNLAHELRTPLTAIKGFTEAMQAHPGQDHARQLRIIHNHTQRLIHLIQDLEQLIRLESVSGLETQDISLETFFDNVRLILEPEVLAKNLYLRIEVDRSAQRLVCDPFRLEQVFINLIQNSLRYTDSGGITIRAATEADSVCFEVADTGRGIAEKYLLRIFERFFVADPSRNKMLSGTGLGLAIVKHIVQLHRGSISVASKRGQGTAFRILIPLRNSAPEDSHE